MFRIQTWSFAVPLLILGSLLGMMGCGSSDPKEVSRETSNFKVAGDESETRDDQKSGDSTKSNLGLANSTATQSSTMAANETSSSIDNRSYMRIAKPPKADAKGWVKFLAEVDNAFNELIMDFSTQKVSQKLFVERGLAVARIKYESAEALDAIAPSGVEKDAAILAKLQSVSHMAGLQDPTAIPRLRELAPQVAKIKNPDAAHEAKLIVFELSISDFESGESKDPTKLIDELDGILANKEKLKSTDFQVAVQALAVLMNQPRKDLADAARKKVSDAFADHSDFQIGSTAWKIRVSESPELNELQAMLKDLQTADAAPIDGKHFAAAIDSFLKAFPSQFSLAFLAGETFNVEYSGFIEHAKSMSEAIQGRIDLINIPEMKREIKEMITSQLKRAAILGKPLNLESLVSLNGLPFDSTRYQGKVVLVEFWATNCQVCIKEMPNIKAVFEQFQDKGFEVVGVNLDKSLEAVDMYFQRDPLPWTTLRSSDPSKVGFDTPLARELGVSAIPFMALIDRNGLVSALHVRGPKLEKKVRELLGQ